MTTANISFVIQSMEIKTGSNKFFKSMRDSEGYYELPGFVFDEFSRNGKLYDTNSTIECMTNPNTRFYRMLTEGTLHGEWGHPKTADFGRLTSIDENHWAMFIDKVYTKKLKTGELVTWVRFKPCGPNGKLLEESLEDSKRNTSLSIRIACVDGPTVPGKGKRLFPKLMVTFDAVGGGGYHQASKRTALENISLESYTYNFTADDITEEVGKNLVHMENYSKESVLEYFKADSIKIYNSINTPKIGNVTKSAINFHNSYMK